jgi:prepilin-type N-terminal cleavage/methylation domain-containing protein
MKSSIISNKSLQQGFTIVELLIVVVVIAILAAITIVSYNGIQNRAHDSVVKSDLENNYKTMQSTRIITGAPHPLGGLTAATGMKFTKASYDTTSNNLYYCASADGLEMAIAGRSKSGKGYVYGTKKGLSEVTSFWSGASACETAGFATGEFRQHGYDGPSSTWYAWAN